MTYHEEIKNWIDNGSHDFETGYNLFVRFSHNRSIALYLARKRDMKKLQYEIQKIYERTSLKDLPVAVPISPSPKPIAPSQLPQAPSHKPRAIASGKVIIQHDVKVDYSQLPSHLKELYDQNTMLYKQLRAIHEQMKLATTDQDRAEKREKLDAVENTIQANWKTIDAELAGNVSETDLEGAIKGQDEYKQVNAARTYLSRNISKLETLTGDKLAKQKTDIIARITFLNSKNADLSPETASKLQKHGIDIKLA